MKSQFRAQFDMFVMGFAATAGLHFIFQSLPVTIHHRESFNQAKHCKHYFTNREEQEARSKGRLRIATVDKLEFESFASETRLLRRAFPY